LSCLSEYRASSVHDRAHPPSHPSAYDATSGKQQEKSWYSVVWTPCCCLLVSVAKCLAKGFVGIL
jgi:hypothetical protein